MRPPQASWQESLTALFDQGRPLCASAKQLRVLKLLKSIDTKSVKFNNVLYYFCIRISYRSIDYTLNQSNLRAAVDFFFHLFFLFLFSD